MTFVDVLDMPIESPLTVESLRPLRLEDLEQTRGILELYADADVPRENIVYFENHLLHRKDSWFVEVVDTGLIYFTNIVPTFKADFNVLFWDRRFGSNRRSLCQQVIATAVGEFELNRVQTFVPVTNKALAYTEMGKIGFSVEGTLRKAWRDTTDVDLIMFGLLAEEVRWPVVDSLKIR